ncbi:MAG: glycosyltransferase [Acidiferrobacterales bacterium]|nr:glycosyltransferase [Acidiferrobacterales bacterium]
MHFGIQTWGSEGDVRPFIALAEALVKEGHKATVIVASTHNREFSSSASKSKLSIHHIPLQHTEEEIDALCRSYRADHAGLDHMDWIFTHMYNTTAQAQYDAGLKLCSKCDVIIRHYFNWAAQAAAEKLNIPEVAILISHWGIPDASAPSQLLSKKIPNLCSILNKLHWWIARSAYNRKLLPAVNTFRARWNLPIKKDVTTDLWASKQLSLIEASPSIVGLRPDWPNHFHSCGELIAPHNDETWVIPDDLQSFVTSQTKKIAFFTIGSFMPDHENEELYRIVYTFCEAARMADSAAIIRMPQCDRSNFPQRDDIFYLGDAPYTKLFPLCDVIVHHGGSGTMHIACASGVPSVIITFIEEQMFWNAELKRLGIAHKAIRGFELTPDNLASAISKILHSKSAKRKAEKLALSMTDENGLKGAIQIIENQFCVSNDTINELEPELVN